MKAHRLSDSTVEQVLELVHEGRLPPKTKLPSEREMVGLLGVSRTSYREAVRIMETMGVLRVVSGRGTWVSERPDWAGTNLGMGWLATNERYVLELLEVRNALEAKAVALAADRASEPQLEGIRQQLDRIRRAAMGRDQDEILAADAAFHMAVAEASGNRILMDASASLFESLSETRRAMMSIPGRVHRTENEHRAIAEAIMSRDSKGAMRTMDSHAARVEREVKVAIHGQELLR